MIAIHFIFPQIERSFLPLFKILQNGILVTRPIYLFNSPCIIEKMLRKLGVSK